MKGGDGYSWKGWAATSTTVKGSSWLGEGEGRAFVGWISLVSVLFSRRRFLLFSSFFYIPSEIIREREVVGSEAREPSYVVNKCIPTVAVFFILHSNSS